MKLSFFANKSLDRKLFAIIFLAILLPVSFLVGLSFFKIPICKVDHIKDAVYHLQASGIKVIAATEKTDQLLYDVSFKEPCAIIMGSEGRGINPSILNVVDDKAKLPILGDIESLNVSVACGAFLYEVVRQRLE